MRIALFRTIRSVFDYCYYRMARFYLNSHFNKYYDSRLSGAVCFVVFLVPLFFAIVLYPMCSLIEKDLLTTVYFPPRWKLNTPTGWTFLIFYILGYRYGSKERYQSLCEKYADDPKDRIRGWGVAGILIVIFAIFVLSVGIFIRPLS